MVATAVDALAASFTSVACAALLIDTIFFLLRATIFCSSTAAFSAKALRCAACDSNICCCSAGIIAPAVASLSSNNFCSRAIAC